MMALCFRGSKSVPVILDSHWVSKFMIWLVHEIIYFVMVMIMYNIGTDQSYRENFQQIGVHLPNIKVNGQSLNLQQQKLRKC